LHSSAGQQFSNSQCHLDAQTSCTGYTRNEQGDQLLQLFCYKATGVFLEEVHESQELSSFYSIGLVVTHFWVPIKNKNKKPKEIRKIIRGGSAQKESEKN
jgi:hypothetical protein